MRRLLVVMLLFLLSCSQEPLSSSAPEDDGLLERVTLNIDIGRHFFGIGTLDEDEDWEMLVNVDLLGGDNIIYEDIRFEEDMFYIPDRGRKMVLGVSVFEIPDPEIFATNYMRLADLDADGKDEMLFWDGKDLIVFRDEEDRWVRYSLDLKERIGLLGRRFTTGNLDDDDYPELIFLKDNFLQVVPDLRLDDTLTLGSTALQAALPLEISFLDNVIDGMDRASGTLVNPAFDFSMISGTPGIVFIYHDRVMVCEGISIEGSSLQIDSCFATRMIEHSAYMMEIEDLDRNGEPEMMINQCCCPGEIVPTCHIFVYKNVHLDDIEHYSYVPDAVVQLATGLPG